MKRMPKLTNEMWSRAFKAFKEGKEPVDLVIEGLLDPDQAKYAYEKYLEMLKGFKIETNPVLTNEMWSRAFKAFRNGLKPLDLVMKGEMGPEEANYAYKKYIELTKGFRGREKSEFEIPNLLIAIFLVGAVIMFFESLALRYVYIPDPLYMLLSMRFPRATAIVLNNIITVLILMVLVVLSSYFIKDKRLMIIPPLLFCIYKVFVLARGLLTPL